MTQPGIDFRGVIATSILLALGTLTAPAAQANSTFASAFTSRYPASATYSAAGCGNTCHGGSTSTFNSFGRDLRTVTGTDAQRLAAIEGIDSDKEGNSNLVEITKNAQPGWCVTTTTGCDNNGRTPPSISLLDPPPATNQPPVARAGGPYTAAVGAAVTLDGSASTDADGTITAYAWNFGNGTTGSGATPSATYASAGTFTVTLTVTDNGGATNQSATTVTVNANTQPPVARPGGPYAGTVNVAITFSGTASSDADGTIVGYTWDFGDGTTGTGASASHSYAATGNYTVRLTVTDNDGLTHSATTTAQVASGSGLQAPVANAGGPYTGTAGSLVSLNGSASTDADGRIVSFDWAFGDGSGGSGAQLTHAYASADNYTVTLTVTDDSGLTAKATTTVTITASGGTGEALYVANCLACHGDPWSGSAVDASLSGLKRVAGARSCTIEGAIFGTSVFRNGVPDMVAFGNQQLSTASIDLIAGYLNSRDATGEQRYVAACAGCHGNDARGGRTGEGVQGDGAGEVRDAIREDNAMRYLDCMSDADVQQVATYLKTIPSSGGGSDGESDGGGGGSAGGTLVDALLLLGIWRKRRAIRSTQNPAV